jgi:squid
VEGIELPFDRQRNRRREFCFIIFDTEDAAEAALREPKQLIGSKECDIRKAQPQQKRMQTHQNMQNLNGYAVASGGGGGGRRGGRRNPNDHYPSRQWNYNGASAQSYYHQQYYGNQYATPNQWSYNDDLNV